MKIYPIEALPHIKKPNRKKINPITLLILTPINYCLELIKMQLKNILFVGLNETQNVHLYVQGAGHIWPGSIYARINSPNSSQTIWDFFSKYDINGVIQ